MDGSKSVADRLAVIRGHALRRQILQAAQEASATGKLVSPVSLYKGLKKPIGQISYHIKVLTDNGALELLGEQPRRGAVEHLYGINKDLLAEITDAVALDRIAEVLEDDEQYGPEITRVNLVKAVRATGRPVEA